MLDAQSTKKEEIDALHAMAEQAGRGSYLATLFTKQLIEELEQRIKVDSTLDIMADYRASVAGRRAAEDAAEHINEQKQKAEDKLANLEDKHRATVKEHHEASERQQALVRQWVAEQQEVKAEIKELQQQLETWKERATKLLIRKEWGND